MRFEAPPPSSGSVPDRRPPVRPKPEAKQEVPRLPEELEKNLWRLEVGPLRSTINRHGQYPGEVPDVSRVDLERALAELLTNEHLEDISFSERTQVVNYLEDGSPTEISELYESSVAEFLDTPTKNEDVQKVMDKLGDLVRVYVDRKYAPIIKDDFVIHNDRRTFNNALLKENQAGSFPMGSLKRGILESTLLGKNNFAQLYNFLTASRRDGLRARLMSIHLEDYEGENPEVKTMIEMLKNNFSGELQAIEQEIRDLLIPKGKDFGDIPRDERERRMLDILDQFDPIFSHIALHAESWQQAHPRGKIVPISEAAKKAQEDKGRQTA